MCIYILLPIFDKYPQYFPYNDIPYQISNKYIRYNRYLKLGIYVLLYLSIINIRFHVISYNPFNQRIICLSIMRSYTILIIKP